MKKSTPIQIHSILIPVTISILIFWVWPTYWGGFVSYAWSTPIIIGASITIGYNWGHTKLHDLVSGFLLFLPILGFSIWSRRVIVLDLNYLIPHDSIPHFMTLVQSGLSPILPLLISAWVGSLWGKCSLTRLFLGLSCISALMANHYFETALFLISERDMLGAAHHISWIEYLRIIPFFGVVAAWKRKNRIEKFIIFLMSIVSAWVIAPPLWLYLSAIPIPEAHSNAPIGNWDSTGGVSSADPKSPHFHQELNAQGTQLLSGWPWWCNSKPRSMWEDNRGASAILKVESSSSLEDLRPVLPEILYRGVTRLGIVGQSTGPLPPPLGPHFERPLARWLLIPPPEGATWGEIIGTQAYFYTPLPKLPVACALWAPYQTDMQTLFSIGQELGQTGQVCNKRLFLIFGKPKENNRETWSAPLVCERPKKSAE